MLTKGDIKFWEPCVLDGWFYCYIDHEKRPAITTLNIGPDLKYHYTDSDDQFGPLHPLELIQEFGGNLGKYTEDGRVIFILDNHEIEWRPDEGFVSCKSVV